MKPKCPHCGTENIGLTLSVVTTREGNDLVFLTEYSSANDMYCNECDKQLPVDERTEALIRQQYPEFFGGSDDEEEEEEEPPSPVTGQTGNPTLS
jgi:hypothetical protein